MFESFNYKYSAGKKGKLPNRLTNCESKPLSLISCLRMIVFFFARRRKKCQTILNILQQYERASRPKINFIKSSIQFGHTVPAATRDEIRNILGMSNVGGMETYLGLPESLGGALSKIFAFVRERLQDRINGWTSKFFSRCGKEVLIKSVAVAMPTYVMSCFKLSELITNKLTSVVA